MEEDNVTPAAEAAPASPERTPEPAPAEPPEDAPEASPAAPELPSAEDRIAELERTVADLRRAAERREAELLLSRRLRDAGLPESFTSLLLRADETALSAEDAESRVSGIADAVRAQAAELLRRRAEPLTPELTSQRPLTPEIIRATPLSALASLL